MIIDMSYWTRVLRRVLYVVLILVGLFLAFKLSVFYMPFLVAFIISLIIEPLIRFIMKRTKLTRNFNRKRSKSWRQYFSTNKKRRNSKQRGKVKQTHKPTR